MATSNNSSVTLIAKGNIKPNRIAIGGGKGGVSNYELLTHKPSINGHELIGNKTNADLGIPTDTQDLTNTAGFITKIVNDLVNYYTKLEIDDIINQIKQSSFRIVDDLPLVGDPGVIYLILNATPQSRNYYDEYIYTDNRWEKIGDTEIDLSGYVTDDELTQALRNYITNTTLNETLRNYYNKADIGEMMAGKADVSSLAPVATSGSYDDLTDKPDIPNDLADLNEDSTHRIVTDAEKATWNNKSDFSGSYNDLTDKPTIPDELADLTDDATHRLVTDTEKQTWDNKSDFSGSYDDLTDKPDIPTVHNSTVTIQKNNQNIDSFTLNQSSNKSINIDVPEKISDIQNDSGFITNTVNNLANYYLKSETYTKTEVSNLINAAVSGRFQKVNALPAQGEANVIYLVPKATVLVDNVYDEYIWEDDSWELIGDTQIDLSGYVTDDDLTAALQNYVTSATFNTTISNYYTKTEVGNLLANKVDKVDGKGLSTYDYDAAAKSVVDGVPAALNNKVDKVDGKGLSTNDYTTADKNKLAGIAEGATKVESSETNGNIKIDSVEIQVYDDSELQDIVDTDTTTVAGNPLNFSTKSAQNAVNTDIVIDPIQDLHGYSKPWVGGAGKNKLPLTVNGIKSANTNGTWSGNVYTYNNVQFTILTDNDNNVIGIKANGQNSSANQFNFTLGADFSFDANVTCHFSGTNSGSYQSFWINIYNVTASSNVADVLTEQRTANINANEALRMRLTIAGNSNVDNIIIYPMARLATETDSSFAPYTNICPISPKEQITVQGCEVNIWDEEWENGVYDSTSGKPSDNPSAIRSKSTNYILVCGNTAYYFKCSVNSRIHFYDINKVYIGNITIDSNRTFTTPENAVYVRFHLNSSYGSTYNNDISMNYPSTDTDYHVYQQSNNLQIPLPNDFYGGTLNLETGELRVDRTYKKDLSNLNWAIESVAQSPFFTLSSSYLGLLPNTGRRNELICDRYKTQTPSVSGYDDAIIGFTSNGDYFRIRDTRYSDATTFKASLTDCEICYPIATPYTLHLTPQQLNLLKTTNNISTDAKTISVTYRNGELSTYAPATDIADGLLTATDKRAIDRTSNIAEGNPIQFSTESKQIARSTIIDLEPIQDLHGYSKPWVGGAGKNKFDSSLMADAGSNIKFITLTLKANTYYTCSTTLPIQENAANLFFMLPDASPSTQQNGVYLNKIKTVQTGNDGQVKVGYRLPSDGTTIQQYLAYNYQVEEGSTSTSYEPYSNICPITGRTEVNLDGCGKNLVSSDNILYNAYINGGTTPTISSGDAQMCYINAAPNTTYTISKRLSARFTVSQSDVLPEIGVVTYSRIIRNDATSITIQTEATTKYICVYYYASSADTLTAKEIFDTLKVELGSQATPYTPYTESNNISIQLDDTVYGGKLNVEKGELVVDKGFITLTGSDVSWYDETRQQVTFENLSLTSLKHDGTHISNLYKNKIITTWEQLSNGEFAFHPTLDNLIRVMDLNIPSKSSAETYFTSNPLQICYEFATPTTIQLTPHQIDILKGINTITTDADNITLQYRNGEVAILEEVKEVIDKTNFKFDNIDSQIDDLYWTFGKVEYTTLSRHSYEQGDYLVWTLDPDLFFIVLQPITIGDALIEGVNIDYVQIGYILKWLENRVSSLLTIMTPPTGLGDYNLVAHRTLGGNVQYEWQMIPSDFDYSHIVTKAGTGVYKTSALDTGSGETIVYISTSNVTRFSICNNIAVGDAPTWGNSGLWLIPVPADANQIRIQLAPGSMLYPVMCSLYHFSQDPATTIKYRYWPDYSPAWYTQSVFTWDMDVIRAECGDVQYYWVAEVCKSGYGNVQPSEVATYMPAITYIKNST